MLYKKSTFGKKYTRYISGSSIVFLSFVMLGAGLIMVLMIMTKIDVIKTYSAAIVPVQDHIAIPIRATHISVGQAYLFSNKQEVVYPIRINSVHKSSENMILHFDIEDQDIIRALSAKKLFIDIPQGKETLLYRVFVKGGRSHE